MVRPRWWRLGPQRWERPEEGARVKARQTRTLAVEFDLGTYRQIVKLAREAHLSPSIIAHALVINGIMLLHQAAKRRSPKATN